LLELAPRDVVARAIAREGMGATSSKSRVVHLDMRHVQGVDLRHRFPGISAVLARYSLNLSRDLIPVRPAAHYLMGGIRTDLYGRTSLPGLYAAGEAACTGVHGANRLASNLRLRPIPFPCPLLSKSIWKRSSSACKPPCGLTPGCCARTLPFASASPLS